MAVSTPNFDKSHIVEFAPASALAQLGQGVVWQPGQKLPSFGYVAKQLHDSRIEPSIVIPGS